MSQKTGLSKAKLLSYVVIEKFIDFIFFVILFFIIVVTSTGVVEDMLAVSIAVIAIITIGLIFYIRFNRLILRAVTIFTPESIFSRIELLNRELLDGIYLFRSLRQILKSGSFFLGAWASIGIIFYLVSWPFLGVLQLPLYAPLVLMVFSALSLAIPSAPSAIGTMHFAFLIAIKLMTDGHYDIDLAVGFIVILHFFIMLFDFVIGAILMGAYNIRSAHASRQL